MESWSPPYSSRDPMSHGETPPYMLPSGRPITGTMVWYYFICKREVWLMSRGIAPDEEDRALEMGRAIHEVFYRDALREVSLEGMKIDVFRRGRRVVCEVKTSSRYLQATRFQLLYYLYRLKEYGVDMVGEILVPREKRRIRVRLDEDSESTLLGVLDDIREIVRLERPPPPARTPYCRRCAYRDFCWA